MNLLENKSYSDEEMQPFMNMMGDYSETYTMLKMRYKNPLENAWDNFKKADINTKILEGTEFGLNAAALVESIFGGWIGESANAAKAGSSAEVCDELNSSWNLSNDTKIAGDIEQVENDSKDIDKLGELVDEGVSKAEFETGYDSHLIDVEDIVRKGNKGIVGGHNLESFEQAFKDRGWNLDDCIISKKPHPTIEGIYEIEYRIPVVNNEGQIIPDKYKNISYPKTVYDPSKISNAEMLEWGRSAMQEGLNAGRVSADGRTITGFSENGLKFIGYINTQTGKITNFYPILN